MTRDHDTAQRGVLDDADLARRIAAAGDDPARDEEAELCRRYHGRLLAFARRRLGSTEGAHDLAQETLLLTLEKLRSGSVRDPERIGAFILGVARALCRDHRPRHSRTRSLDDVAGELVATTPPPADPIARARVVPCFESLPDRQRAVVLLSFYAEQSSGEVAESLGLTANHVRVLRHRGVAQLRDCLGATVAGAAR